MLLCWIAGTWLAMMAGQLDQSAAHAGLLDCWHLAGDDGKSTNYFSDSGDMGARSTPMQAFATRSEAIGLSVLALGSQGSSSSNNRSKAAVLTGTSGSREACAEKNNVIKHNKHFQETLGPFQVDICRLLFAILF